MFKGLFMHSIAKIVFVICSYAIHLYLGKTLSAAEYGIVGVVITVITFSYNFLSNGARQAASRLLATKQYNEVDIVKKSMLLQFGVATVLTILNYGFAEQIANVLNAPNLEPYIRVTAYIIPFTAAYFICVGIFNGLKLFAIEATIVTIYPLLRLTVIPYVGIFLKNGALGTIAGFFTAAAGAFILCFIMLAKVRRTLVAERKKIPLKLFLQNTTNFLLFFSFVTIILNIDMLFINALVDNPSYVGYYTGAVNFAKVSYYLLTAVYIVALPIVTQEYAQKNYNKAQDTIKTLFLSVLLFVFPIVSITGASSGNVLASFYKAEYRAAASTAGLLILSQFFIGLFVVLNMFITATQSKRYSTAIAAFITVIDIILCIILIPVLSIKGAAIASVISSGIGCIISFRKSYIIYGKIWNSEILSLVMANIFLSIIIHFIQHFWIIENLFILFIFFVVTYLLFIGLMILLKIVNLNKIIMLVKKKK